jgi:hypothetical protein
VWRYESHRLTKHGDEKYNERGDSMKFVNTDPYLLDIWKPRLEEWIEEARIENTEFNVTLLPCLERFLGCRGSYSITEETIHLCIGSGNLQEIKYTFLHEVGHHMQALQGTLARWERDCEDNTFLLSLEHDAHKYALQHGGKPTELIELTWKAWGFSF